MTQPGFPTQSSAKDDGKFLEFEAEAFVRLQCCGRVAVKQMPDLHQQLAGNSGDGDVTAAFAGKELPAPFTQGCVAACAKHGLGSLNEKVADIAAAAFSNAQADVFAFAALALTGVEPDTENTT